ncbi:MAG: hypothetical protein ABJB12_14940 [Pseudomonadota bacterium]
MDDEETYFEGPIELDVIDDPGNDDAESTTLDVGEETDILAENIGDNEPIELDLGTLVGIDDAARDGDDDDTGFEVDPSVGLALPDALTPDDGNEGLDDGAIKVDESKFPSLEQDDGEEGIAAEPEISLGTASDEAAVPLAASPWLVLLPAASLEACMALGTAPGSVVAASSDLLWFRSDSTTPLRVAVEGSALADLVLVGPEREVALTCTQSGQLFRRARFASQAEQLTRLRETLKAPPGARLRLAFGGALAETGGRILLCTDDGALFDVLDSGDRFERIDLPGKVTALARESATALLAQGKERSLVRLVGQGSTRTTQPLAEPALSLAQNAAPLLATCGDALALAEFGRALLVSADRGKSFRRVAGGVGSTALCGAELSGSAQFFAAVYRETSDESQILLIDPVLGSALCVARLDSGTVHPAHDVVDRGEWAKVARMVWHGPSQRLWIAGGFGVATVAATDLV